MREDSRLGRREEFEVLTLLDRKELFSFQLTLTSLWPFKVKQGPYLGK